MFDLVCPFNVEMWELPVTQMLYQAYRVFMGKESDPPVAAAYDLTPEQSIRSECPADIQQVGKTDPMEPDSLLIVSRVSEYPLARLDSTISTILRQDYYNRIGLQGSESESR